MPIPHIGADELQEIITLVDAIVAAKSAGPHADSSDLEECIEWLVYDLYGLTDGEVSTIADALWSGEVSEEKKRTPPWCERSRKD